MVYVILNGKGIYVGVVCMDMVLFSLFLTDQSNTAGEPPPPLCMLWLSSGEKEDQIQCELIGGGSYRHFNTFTNLFVYFIVAVHYTYQYMLCIVD